VFFVVNMGDPVGCGYGSETEIVVSTLVGSRMLCPPAALQLDTD
jgi:hypothetical protein